MENISDSTTKVELSPIRTDLPELLIDKAVLYHGSGTPGIREFLPADETTIGRGVYLTSDPVSAKGYALLRVARKESKSPVVYEVETDRLRLADLRADEGIDKFASLLREELIRLIHNTPKPLPSILVRTVNMAVERIDKHSFRGLKDITWNFQDIVTSLIREKGFDGLVAIEGGEGDMGNHDSYVIFDPKKVKILEEIK